MAELLIRSKPHPDPMLDIGDAVDIRPDGFTWGRRECLKTWLASGGALEDWTFSLYVVKIPGVPVEDLNYLLEPLLDANDVMLKNRRWRAAIESIPAELKTALNTDGEAEVTLETALLYVVDKAA